MMMLEPMLATFACTNGAVAPGYKTLRTIMMVKVQVWKLGSWRFQEMD